MSNVAISAANLSGDLVLASGTANGAVECRLEITPTGAGPTVWAPANGWLDAEMNDEEWSSQIPVPEDPSPATYRFHARLKQMTGKSDSIPVSTSSPVTV